VDNTAIQASPLKPGDLWLRIKNRRWIVIGCLIAGWIAGTALGWFIPAKYRSETVILVEQQKVPEHYVEPNVSADLQQRLQNISQRILSRTRLLSLIDKFGLYGVGDSHADPDSLVERMRKDITIELMKTETRRDELSSFKVSYSAGSSKLARDVTRDLVSFFIDEDLRNRAQLSEDTTKFLSTELDDARKSLATQEDKLRQFRSRYLGELPEQLQGNLQILGALEAQLQSATDSLNRQEQKSLYLRSQLDQSESAPASIKGVPSVSGMTLDQQLQALKAQLSELSGRYTPRHPDILLLKQQIAELEAQKAQMRESASKAAVADQPGQSATQSSLNDNPASAQLRSELAANDFEITTQKAKIKHLEQQIVEYQGRLNLTPALEQQAAGITRDYEQSRTYYDSLLAKKLQSEMSTNLEKRREGEQFVMIDPPQLPEHPYFPNRLLMAAGGLGAGLAIGLAIVMLLELLLAPHVYQEAELAEFARAGFTLSIPTVITPAELRRKTRLRVVEAIAAAVLCVVIPGLTVLTYYKG
jgi:succinoglycan biosynthesis transport protein ExoP